jgi:hypothetical protein
VKVADLFAKLSLLPDKKSFDTGDKLIRSIKTALAGIVAFSTVKWFGGLINETSAAADAAAKMGQRMGISTEAVQEFQHAAGLSGTSVDALRVGFLKLNAGIEATAKTGKGPAADALRALGISMGEPAVRGRDMEGVLGLIADRFAEMPNDARKTQLAMDLLGKGGAELIPMLNAGATGIEEMRKEARELGIVIDSETAASFESFNDDQDRVRAAFRGIRNQVVAGLLPELRKITEGVIRWVRANRQLIRQRLQQVLHGLIAAAKLLARTIGLLVRILGWMRDNFGAVVLAVGAVTTALLIMRAASIKAAIASAAAWVASLLPFILLAAAIFAVILVVEDLYRAFTGGESAIKRLYDAAKKWIDEKLGEVLERATDRVAEFLDVGGIFGVRGSRERRDAARAALAEAQVEEEAFEARLDAAIVAGEKARADAAAFDAMPPAAKEAFFAANRARAAEIMGPRAADVTVPGRTVGGQELNIDLTINAAGVVGQDAAQKIATTAVEAVQRFWDSQIRATAAATGQ